MGRLPDADTIRVFAAHAVENPLVAYQDASGDPSPVRLSDFITALCGQPRVVQMSLAPGTTVYPSFTMCGGTSRFSARA